MLTIFASSVAEYILFCYITIRISHNSVCPSLFNILMMLKTIIYICCYKTIAVWVNKALIRSELYIIIILSCHQHGYPWPSLTTLPYHSSLPAGPQGYTLYPHRATVWRFELVALLLLGHVKGSIGVHHLWARPYFSNCVPHVWFF